MPHTVFDRKPLLTRIRRIQGQAAALERALQNEEECAAVLQQLAAIRGAVNGLMLQVLEGHVREQFGAEGGDKARGQAALDVVVSLLRSYVK